MDKATVADQQFITQNVIPPMIAYGAGRSAQTAFVVSVYPVFQDTIGKFGEQIPWTWAQEYPYGGKTIVRMPAALRGKNVWRKIKPDKLLQPTPPDPEDLKPERLAANGGIWYYEDRIQALKDPNEYGFSVLQIFDALHWSMEPFRQEALIPQRVDVESFARDGIVTPWTNGMRIPQSGGKIGLGYCREEKEVPALVASLKAYQKNAFIALVNEAHELDRMRKNDQITDFHRIAYDWLGLPAGAATWRAPFTHIQDASKPCLLCNAPLSKDAINCQKCGILPLRYLEAMDAGLELTIPADDPIAVQIKNIREKRKKG